MLNARRAARELAAAGASRVLLFGSVARGDANARSDIDLVAIFDDIDYSRRLSLRLDLRAAAEAAAGHAVEVYVTDRPEWERRTSAVSASFEAVIAPDAEVLIDRPPVDVRWDKEIALPDNNIDEALGRVDEAAKALDLMLTRLRPGELEVQAFTDGDREAENSRRHWRLTDVCTAGAMAVETSLKALSARAGKPAPYKHNISALVPLTGDRYEDVTAALAALADNTLSTGGEPYNDITIWRQAGTYIADRPDINLEATSRLAPLIAAAALELTTIAADALAERSGCHPAIDRARVTVEAAERTLETSADIQVVY